MTRQSRLDSINRYIRLLIWHGHKQAVETMEQLGLTLPQASVLFGLEASDGQATMSDLARMAQLSPATMTGIVDRLIAAGFVERTRDQQDRRVVFVKLTREGYAKAEAIHSNRLENMGVLTTAFSVEELAQLEHLLERLLDAMLQQSER